MELLRSINAEIAEKEELKNLEEAGLLKKGLGKVAGAVGMKGTAANLQAQGEADQKVKQMKIAFNQFAGQMGKKMNDATAGDLASFLKSKNLPVVNTLKRLGNRPLSEVDKNLINQAFNVAIKGGAKRQLRQQTSQGAMGQPAQQQTQQPQQGKLGNIAKALATLSPSDKNSLIAALQS